MARRNKQNDDQSSENFDNTDETFGLPEIEYEPLNREEEREEPATASEESEQTVREREEVYHHQEVHHDHTHTYDHEYHEEESSVWPKILGIAALLIVAAGVYWFFWMYQPEQARLKQLAEREQAAKDSIARKDEADRQEKLRLEAEQRRLDSLANAKPVIGTIETLNDRTGRYHVVIASSIDGDLIMDYAKKLSPKGVSSTIIEPYGKVKFYRLTIEHADTYADAQVIADGLKDQYGPDVWVIRY